MTIKSFKPRFNYKTAVLIGLLFLSLGVASQSETSWLFTVAGALALIQATFDKRRANSLD